jgi:hypothetical protein
MPLLKNVTILLCFTSRPHRFHNWRLIIIIIKIMMIHPFAIDQSVAAGSSDAIRRPRQEGVGGVSPSTRPPTALLLLVHAPLAQQQDSYYMHLTARAPGKIAVGFVLCGSRCNWFGRCVNA